MVRNLFQYLEALIGVAHERDRQTDGQTDRMLLAIAPADVVRRSLKRSLKSTKDMRLKTQHEIAAILLRYSWLLFYSVLVRMY